MSRTAREIFNEADHKKGYCPFEEGGCRHSWWKQTEVDDANMVCQNQDDPDDCLAIMEEE